MSLLVLDGVSKRYVRGGRLARAQIGLRDVSLAIAQAELVAVWGRRRSGRTTLLRVAAGIEAPTAGSVHFAGEDLRRSRLLGVQGGIGYVTTSFARVLGDSVLEHVAAPLLGAGIAAPIADARALETLRRVGAAGCAALAPDELDHGETVRVGIARALVVAPRLLLVDEPTSGTVSARARDALLGLLRSIADRERVAVLVTVDEAADLAGADRALTVDCGELRGETTVRTAPVVPLRRADARGS